MIMAIFHFHCDMISRGKGKSAVAGAAYISREKLKNEYNDIVFDYRYKKSDLQHTEIMLPAHAPSEYADRYTLWNAVEKIEKAVDSQLARDIDIALPKELSLEENLKLVKEFCQANFVNRGMCVDFAIHDKGDDNPHVHVMLTTRKINPNGEWDDKEKKVYALDENGERIPVIDEATGQQKIGAKNRKMWKRIKVKNNDWNDRDNVSLWREAWANVANKYLEQNGFNEQIDHRSYEEQGLDKIPTVHLGYAACEMRSLGERSEKWAYNASVKAANSEIAKYEAVIKEKSPNAECC